MTRFAVDVADDEEEEDVTGEGAERSTAAPMPNMAEAPPANSEGMTTPMTGDAR